MDEFLADCAAPLKDATWKREEIDSSAMDACFVWGGGCSMDDSGSRLATAMVAFLVANPALDDCFLLGWRLFDGRQRFWARYGSGHISSRQSNNGCLLLLGWRLFKVTASDDV